MYKVIRAPGEGKESRTVFTMLLVTLEPMNYGMGLPPGDRTLVCHIFSIKNNVFYDNKS